MNVSKSGSRSDTRASTKSCIDGVVCNIPAEKESNRLDKLKCTKPITAHIIKFF